MPPSEIHVKRFKPEEVDILKRNNEFVCTCRTGDIFQEGQPLSIAVYKAGCNFKRESRQHSAEEEARDPDPDVELDKIFGILHLSESCCSHNKAEEQPKLDAAREQRSICLKVDDDPDYEEVMKEENWR